VRPIVDVIYVIAYYWTTIFGFLSGKFTFEQSGIILSRSMIMHGLVLPALSILPLVMKFLQSLRQAHDTGKRLPYLGNTFKYGTAMLVILYGMTHAAGERSPYWVSAFVLATIYQIVWDVFIDWELLVIVPRQNEEINWINCALGQNAYLMMIHSTGKRCLPTLHCASVGWRVSFQHIGLII
jgi:hypothetical protein